MKVAWGREGAAAMVAMGRAALAGAWTEGGASAGAHGPVPREGRAKGIAWKQVLISG